MCQSEAVASGTRRALVIAFQFASATLFLLFAALSGDGYFVAHPRYVYSFRTLNASNATNLTYFETLDAPLVFNSSTNGTSPTPPSQSGHEVVDGSVVYFNLTRIIAPGPLANSSAMLLLVAPSGGVVPGLAVLLISAIGLCYLLFLLANMVRDFRLMGCSCAVAARLVCFSHGHSAVQQLLQLLFFALVAFSPSSPSSSPSSLSSSWSASSSWLSSSSPLSSSLAPWPPPSAPLLPLSRACYALLAMELLLCAKCLLPLLSKCLCRHRLHLTDEELVLLPPQGVTAFFMLSQVPIVIAKFGGTTFRPWATLLTPIWLLLIINTVGWGIFGVWAVRSCMCVYGCGGSMGR
jgi:hypothetical protein